MTRPRYITTTIERGRPAVWDRDRRRMIHSYEPGQEQLAAAMAEKLNADARPTISESDAERIMDNIVQRRLATDSAYRNAENAEQQAEREAELEREALVELGQRYRVTP